MPRPPTTSAWSSAATSRAQVVAIALLQKAHRQAVERFSEGKGGPRMPDEPEPPERR